MEIQTKRIYDDSHSIDGCRVLVDRLWPRGVSKEEAELEDWCKELAPSDELRRWFDHDSEKWETFQSRYREELEEKSRACRDLLEQVGTGPLILLYAAKDTEYNNAVVLKNVLEELESDSA